MWDRPNCLLITIPGCHYREKACIISRPFNISFARQYRAQPEPTSYTPAGMLGLGFVQKQVARAWQQLWFQMGRAYDWGSKHPIALSTILVSTSVAMSPMAFLFCFLGLAALLMIFFRALTLRLWRALQRKAAISPELVRSIQHGCSLVVGTGATLNMMDRHRTQADFSRAKDWTGLLAGSLNHAISMLHLDQKYPRLGNDATEAEAEAALKELTQVVGGVGMPPSEFRSICVGSILTQLQVDLDCPTAKGLQALAPLMKWVATLNFDDFLERVLWRTPRVHLPTGPVYPIVQHSQSRAFYYHLHGVAGGQASDAPAMLCHKDYAEALPAFKEVYFSHMRASS
ncbi:hypothetical protein WJX84_010699 [Apatococcus fuscideae]|uniref:Uncharacterized protein n=1 Tax=Apatococcus fuscideae TaxID=2026836 RepID=A0AAW1S015_9CHLO